MVKAPVGKRIIAYLIDVFILTAVIVVPIIGLTILTMVVAMAVPRLAGMMGLLMIPVSLIAIVLSMAYWLLRDGLKGGRSFGKKFMKLKVVKGGKPCSYVDSLLRNITLAIPFVNFIDLIMALVDAEGMRIGDKIAKTQVVEA